MAIIFIKVIHELAHSYTTAFFGVKVRSLGVAFIFFVPRLYSDVSDSVTLPPNKRLLIASAGIIAEFILGGLAAIVFLAFPQGQAISIIAASVTSVSLLLTLLFNANPFMRFDGYYMLSDALDIPNLSSRSKDCLKNVFHRVLWGEKFKKVPLQGFLTVFGFLSWCYRISLYTSFVVIIWHFQLKSLAIPLTILEIYIFFIGPIIQEIKFYQSKKRTIKMKHKVIFISLITALAGVLFIPVNLPVSAPAYVSSTEFGTELRSKINGTIKEVSGADILLTNPLLEYELDEGKLELDLYKQTESFYQSQKDYSLMLLQQQLQDKTTLKIDTLEDSKENLRVKYSGLIKEENLIGKYIPAGQIITRTYDPKTIYICTYIPAVDYKESISTGVLKFKYHDAFDVEVIKVITSPQLFLPECLIKRNGGFIEVTENRHPLATHYLLVLKLRNNTDKISNYSRSAEFIYHDKKSLFNTFYTQIASFISRELI
ncbi:MAG: site-2 protease family protein [Lentisphaeraceae bacterium]|nr:site-2 protease family protein [Lentisphaeraceae bacterium]